MTEARAVISTAGCFSYEVISDEIQLSLNPIIRVMKMRTIIIRQTVSPIDAITTTKWGYME